jgi:hypothetical protein
MFNVYSNDTSDYFAKKEGREVEKESFKRHVQMLVQMEQ